MEVQEVVVGGRIGGAVGAGVGNGLAAPGRGDISAGWRGGGNVAGGGSSFQVSSGQDEYENVGTFKGPVSPTEPFEREIRDLIDDFILNSVCRSNDERWSGLGAIFGQHRQLSSDCKGLYRLCLSAIKEGFSVKAILTNLMREESEVVGGVSRSGFFPFPIDLADVRSHSPTLYTWILDYPSDLIVYFDEEVKVLMENETLIARGVQFTGGLRVTFFNHPEVCALRDLDQTSLERLVAVKGTCIRVSPVIPEMQVAVFKCTARTSRQFEFVQCNNEVSGAVINGSVKEPLFCNICQGRKSFVLVHDKCVFTTKQMMKVQEHPETIPEGETPQTLFMYVYDEMVDAARPGDHLQVTGIFKAAPVKRSAHTRSIKSVFRTCIDAVHVGRDRSTGGIPSLKESCEASGDPQRTFHPGFIARARALSEQPNAYQLLTDAFAPNIWEYMDVKRGLLCQLFGGSTEWIKDVGGKSPSDKSRLRSRGEIHVLLCGDPSTAKSQFLQYVHKIAPRGIYAVGRGTSAAGLTATVTREPETRDFVLEPGAVILSDRGICCIDEFDKMDDGTRAILHEVMEQQTVSLAKAGIVCSLNARTAILASANPVKSRYDTKQSVIENINLPATLLSRFDLIYLILDAQNETLDRKLAEHLCHLYTNSNETNQRQPTSALDRAFLSEYISYARTYSAPILSEEAKTELVETYVALRGTDAKGTIRATPRQLDSLVRLSTALAKMKLKSEVSTDEVKEAARLTRAATYQALTDPFTGRIDFEQLHTGASEAVRMRQSLLGDIVMSLLRDNASSGGVNREDMVQHIDENLASQGRALLGRRELEQALNHFEAIGLVSKVQGSKYVAVTQH